MALRFENWKHSKKHIKKELVVRIFLIVSKKKNRRKQKRPNAWQFGFYDFLSLKLIDIFWKCWEFEEVERKEENKKVKTIKFILFLLS